jgi:hypothetical protein
MIANIHAFIHTQLSNSSKNIGINFDAQIIQKLRLDRGCLES